ncbi:SLC13 family permease [Gallaecimonas kandeliae]|uniref:SLC13 family permease n=1 Tax=Gallaecimonas kandeliae TaxID=3029055 RepID=UPI002648D11C|nr:SLC13 family permease [Gallaecimonas kandeliae]WKE67136.1 SLC13 family permease [Gallaecimonas kandeliae]
MDWQGCLVLGLTITALLLMVFTRLAPHLVMAGVLVLLSLFGVLSGPEALAGFSNAGLITVAAMLVVAGGLNASGGVDYLVHKLLGRPQGLRGALGKLMAPVLVLSAFLNNTPVVATFIPAIHGWSRKLGLAPSKLMIPLSYSAILGGTLTLIGTSTNLIVNGQYQSLTGQAGFSLFSISLVGLPVALVGIAFIWLAFPRLLPNRSDDTPFENLREFTLEVAVAPDGPLVGKSIREAGLRELKRVFLVEIERSGQMMTAVAPEERLKGGDRLVFAGDTEAISELLRINGIVASAEHHSIEDLRQPRDGRRLVEVVVSPHCAAVGQTIRDARFRARYGAIVLAVARGAERIKGNLGSIRLEAGDTLLLEARPAFVSRQRYNKDFLLVNDLDVEPPRHKKALLAWAILLGLVGAAGFGLISMLNAALAGAALMLVTGCMSVGQAEKSLDLPLIITIASSFALGAAMQKTGVATWLAQQLLGLSGGKAWLLLILVYVAVSLLTELVTNNAAALVMLPIVLEVTGKAGLDPTPFVFALMIAASASFATPLGYQTNLMVLGPGGYRFNDFLKVGIPMNLLVGLTTVTVLLLGWPLT